MQKLISQKEFLKKYNVKEDDFGKTGINWKNLEAIYEDYQKYKETLESPATHVFNNLAKCPKVHSVRYRIKDSEHVIEKIIRKAFEEKQRVITIENYRNEITDLIGIRAIHLYKNDWTFIHEYITEKWNLKESPIANYRKGDSEEYLKDFQQKECVVKEHKYGYRSIHYIIETQLDKERFYSEIQIRTIFEEGWSEIDHDIRYPYELNNELLAQFLLIFNRLAGSSDEMGSYIKFLQHELKEINSSTEAKLSEKESKIKELLGEIDKLKIQKVEKEALREKVKKLDDHEMRLWNINSMNEIWRQQSQIEKIIKQWKVNKENQ